MRFRRERSCDTDREGRSMFHLQISVTAAYLNTHFTRTSIQGNSPLEDVWFGGVVTQKWKKNSTVDQ